MSLLLLKPRREIWEMLNNFCKRNKEDYFHTVVLFVFPQEHFKHVWTLKCNGLIFLFLAACFCSAETNTILHQKRKVESLHWSAITQEICEIKGFYREKKKTHLCLLSASHLNKFWATKTRVPKRWKPQKSKFGNHSKKTSSYHKQMIHLRALEMSFLDTLITKQNE